MRVAVLDHDIAHRYAEPIGNDLGEDRLVALAVRTRAGDGGDFAARLDADDAALEAGAGAGLDERRQPDTRDLPASATDISLVDQRLPIGYVQRAIERPLVVARVVRRAKRVRIRECLARHEVLVAHRYGVQLQFTRGSVHRAFDQQHRLWSACASVRTGAHGVGHHSRDLHRGVGDRVAARRLRQRPARWADCRGLQVRAQVAVVAHPQTCDGAVAVERQGHLGAHVASLLHAEEVLAARGYPFDWPFEVEGEPAGDGVLAVHVVLDAEGAAHVGGDHADAVFGHAEHARQRRAQPERRMGRDPDGETVAQRVGCDEDGPRLDGRARQPRAVDAHAGDVLRLREGALHVSTCAPGFEDLVAAQLRPGRHGAWLDCGLELTHT